MRVLDLQSFKVKSIFIKLFLISFVGLSIASMLVGIAIPDSIRASLVIAIQISTGAAFWVFFKPRSSESIHELFGMGLAVGSTTAVVSHLVLFKTFLGGNSWAVPSVVLLVVAVTFPRVRNVLSAVNEESQGPHMLPSLVMSTAVGLSFWWWWTLPIVLALLVMRFMAQASLRTKRYSMGLIAGLGTVVIAVAASYMRNLNNTWWMFSYDQIFSETMSVSLANWGPTDNIQLAGSELSYHWLALAWAGITTHGAGVGSWIVVTKILPICALLGVLSLLWSISTRLSTSRIVPVATVFSFSLISNPFLLQPSRFINSPTFYLSMLWLLAFSLLFIDGINQRGGQKYFFLTFMFCSALASKVSSGAVVFGGVTFALFAAIIGHRRDAKLIRYLTTLFGLLIFSTIAIYFLMYQNTPIGAESNNALYWDLFQFGPTLGLFNYESTVLARFVSLVAVLMCFLPMISASIYFLFDSRKENSAAFTFLAASTLAGLFGVVAFNHDGGSQLYFWLASMTTAPILVVKLLELGFTRFGTSISKQKYFLVVFFGLLTALLVEVFWNGSIFGSVTQRQLSVGRIGLIAVSSAMSVVVAFLISRVWKIQTKFRKKTMVVIWMSFALMCSSSIGYGAIHRAERTNALAKRVESDTSNPDLITGSDAHIEALHWLRENSQLNDVVAVNRYCIPGIDSCVSKWALVTALSHRRALIEGGYFDATRPPDSVKDKIRYSIDFAEQPNTNNHKWLLEQNVTWVVVDHSTQASGLRNWEPFGVNAFTNELVTIVRLNK
jgi:hypothetical protein